MAKNRKNVYACGKGHRTVTVDVDDGVTPMQIRCTHPGCKNLARSSYYQVEQNLKPTHEWYRPETMSGLSPNDVAHVKSGGLLIRKI
jgi:hypothetical protein